MTDAALLAENIALRLREPVAARLAGSAVGLDAPTYVYILEYIASDAVRVSYSPNGCGFAVLRSELEELT